MNLVVLRKNDSFSVFDIDRKYSYGNFNDIFSAQALAKYLMYQNMIFIGNEYLTKQHYIDLFYFNKCFGLIPNDKNNSMDSFLNDHFVSGLSLNRFFNKNELDTNYKKNSSQELEKNSINKEFFSQPNNFFESNYGANKNRNFKNNNSPSFDYKFEEQTFDDSNVNNHITSRNNNSPSFSNNESEDFIGIIIDDNLDLNENNKNVFLDGNMIGEISGDFDIA